MEISPREFPIARRRARNHARALLFAALNVVAVPACQHFEGDGTARRGDKQAEVRPAPAAPAAVPSDVPLPPPRA